MAVAERRPEIKIPFLGIIPWTFKELSVPWGLYPGDRSNFLIIFLGDGGETI